MELEYESDREKAIAYRMHNKGYDIGYIAATLDESEQTIEQWIYDEDRDRGTFSRYTEAIFSFK